MIHKNWGGTLFLRHVEENGSGREIMLYLTVLPGTIDHSKRISVSFDDADNIGTADLVFEPHGTVFSKPALLTMFCKNFDLTGINPDDLKFYYINESGEWEQHPAYRISVDIAKGNISIIGAQLPHFSRYAIGLE